MNYQLLITTSNKLFPIRHTILRSVSSSKKGGVDDQTTTTTKPFPSSQLNKLQSILTDMKIGSQPAYLKKLEKFGNSDLFDYATNKKFEQKDLKTNESTNWKRLYEKKLYVSYRPIPKNGLEQMILLTEQGKLWKYPIDNEQGLDHEKQVPFEDHVFLENLLEDFPKHDYIQQFMGFICSGLAKNHTMTVERKREIIKFYKDYFEEHKELYKASGLEL